MSDSPPRAATSTNGSGSSLVGTVISGRYKVESLLGAGGMGSVYLVEHTHMHKRYALKILNSQTAQNPEMVARFEREAMAAAHIEHPNVTVAIDFGKAEDGAFFLVLEYLKGRRLRDVMDSGPLELRRAIHIIRQVASALERSHELGVIHRDLKPENIMLVSRQGDPDFVKVLDFGLAKVTTGMLAPGGDVKGQAITKHGSVFGTPKYMAPEQCVGGSMDARTDLYALGLIMYEMLTGVHPFTGKDNFRLIMHQLNTPTPPIKTVAPSASVPASLEAVIMRLTEKDPEKRYANATELLAALTEVVDKERISPPDPSNRISAPPSRSAPALQHPSNADQTVSSVEVLSEADLTNAKPASTAAVETRPVEPVPAKSAPAPVLVTAPAHPAMPSTSLEGFETAEKPRPSPSAPPIGSRQSGARSPLDKLLERLPVPLKRVPPAILLIAPITFLSLVISVVIIARDPKKPARTASQGASKPPSVTRENVEQEAAKHRAAAQSYVAQKNGVEALRFLAKAWAMDANSITEGDIKPAMALSLSTPDAAEAAISLLEGELGAPGIDVLYALAIRPGPSQHKARLNQSLHKPEVRANASRAALIALDLHAKQKCEDRRALLPRAAQEGDQRTLEQLQLMIQKQNCGPMGILDCWSCLRQDAALQNAIAAIEARVKLRN